MNENARKTKIELVKEVDQFGKILYSIEKDGFYQSGTVTQGGMMSDTDEVKQQLYNDALIKFDAFVASAIYDKTKEIIKVVEI